MTEISWIAIAGILAYVCDKAGLFAWVCKFTHSRLPREKTMAFRHLTGCAAALIRTTHGTYYTTGSCIECIDGMVLIRREHSTIAIPYYAILSIEVASENSRREKTDAPSNEEAGKGLPQTNGTSQGEVRSGLESYPRKEGDTKKQADSEYW